MQNGYRLRGHVTGDNSCRWKHRYFTYRSNGEWVTAQKLMIAGGRFNYPGPIALWTRIDDNHHIIFVGYVDILRTFFLRRFRPDSVPPTWIPPRNTDPINLFSLAQSESDFIHSGFWTCDYNSVNSTLITAFADNTPYDHQIYAGIVEDPETLTQSSSPENTGVILELPQYTFERGNIFYLSVYLQNNDSTEITARLYVLLEADGVYYFWDAMGGGWSEDERYNIVRVQPGRELKIIIPRFWWPANENGSARLIAALVNPERTAIIGEYDEVDFSWVIRGS